MSHHEYQQDRPMLEPSYEQHVIQKFITSLVLLLIAYYVFPYVAYETTIKRTLYEFTLKLIPLRFLALMQSLVLRLRPEDRLNFHHNLSDFDAKGQALSQIYHGSGIPAVVQKARRLSGYDKIMPPLLEDVYSGLNNWDNSCFQNSVLQALACLPLFSEYLAKSLRFCDISGTGSEVHDDLVSFLGKLGQQVNKRTSLWPPASLKSLDTWQQQDAQEYLSKILDTLDKEAQRCWKNIAKRLGPDLSCVRNANMSNNLKSRIENQSADVMEEKLTQMIPVNPIEGMLAQTLMCQKCGFSEGYSLMPFNCLTLNLGLESVGRLEDLLDAYTAPELIEGVECDGCTRLAEPSHEEAVEGLENQKQIPGPSLPKEKRPKVRSTKGKQITFGRMPNDLVFHINRSIFDMYGNQRKNTAPITFPAKLRIDQEWIAPINGDLDTEEPLYELRCVITHSGRHDNGHYVAYGKRGKNWFSFNDEIVTRTTEEMALSRSNVFMLFYEKVESNPSINLSPKLKPANDKLMEETSIVEVDEIMPSTETVDITV